MNAEEWAATEKEIDPSFAGSIWEKLGYTDKLCPTCGAHIYGDICLNACHLGDASQLRFNQLMRGLAK